MTAPESAVESTPPPPEPLEEVTGYFGDQGAFVSPDMTFPDTSAPLMWSMDVMSTFEPSFASLGLGGYWPWGIAQQVVEQIHLSGVPWWATVVGLAVTARLVFFPVYVFTQKNAARLNLLQPTIDRLHKSATYADEDGDNSAASRARVRIKQLMKDEKCSPQRTVVAGAIQIPVFIGSFYGLRQLCELPVVSMQTGGLLWFQDLTASDPYFILPAAASLSLYGIIKVRWCASCV